MTEEAQRLRMHRSNSTARIVALPDTVAVAFQQGYESVFSGAVILIVCGALSTYLTIGTHL